MKETHYLFDKASEKFVLAAELQEEITRKKPNFIRGPIPVDWILECAAISGKGLRAGLLVWFIRGLKKGGEFSIGSEFVEDFGLTRQTWSRCLKEMEVRGLVMVVRKDGRLPRITILRDQRGDKI